MRAFALQRHAWHSKTLQCMRDMAKHAQHTSMRTPLFCICVTSVETKTSSGSSLAASRKLETSTTLFTTLALPNSGRASIVVCKLSTATVNASRKSLDPVPCKQTTPRQYAGLTVTSKHLHEHFCQNHNLFVFSRFLFSLGSRW